ncbi:MAG: asparaginase [Pseudomonadota bacterium]|nr:asparaginase [Pseudomonadota bacterium]
MPLVVEQLRGGLVETSHPIVAAVADITGVRWSADGTPGGVPGACFWRSSSKPLQLLSSLEQLPAATVSALSDADLAIGAASHGATPAHTAVVASLLERFGLTEEGLRCGAHWPSHDESARGLVRAGRACSAIHNNCSGKHTFMLAAATSRGWDPDYRPIDHPLQQVNAARFEDWSGAKAGIAVDGCGVPTFHVPVSAMATAFCRLATEMRAGSLAGRIGWAMNHEPDLVSSPGELDALLMRSAREPLTAKRGAEGLMCIALPERGVGIAIKCTTGSGSALAVAVRAVLAEVAPGVLDPDAAWPWCNVKNVVGAAVGERRAVWT